MVSTEIPSGMARQEGTAVGPVDATSPPSEAQTDTTETPQETETSAFIKPSSPPRMSADYFQKRRGKRRRNQLKLDF